MNVRVYIIYIIHTTYTYIIKVHNRESKFAKYCTQNN